MQKNKSKQKDKSIALLGQNLVLMPEKTLYWQEAKTLLAADVHIGKDTAFRRAGIAVPDSVTDSNLKKLSDAIKRSKAERLIFLGDFQHSKAVSTVSTIEKVSNWRNQHSELEIVLIIGNHDHYSGKAPKEWRFQTCSTGMSEGPFQFRHEPLETARSQSNKAEHPFTFAGHIHPSVSLYGKGKQREKLPCFYFEKNQAILPAFGEFTGTMQIEPEAGSRVFVVAGNSIIEYGTKNN